MKSSKKKNEGTRVSGQRKEAMLRKIEEAFLADLGTGVYRVGEALPSLREIASRYGVPYRVGSEFYQYLHRRGKVIIVPRQGVFLAGEGVADPLRPSVQLKRKGILVVTRIETAHPYAKYNDNVKQLYALESECATAGVPMHFYNLHWREQSRGAISDETLVAYQEDIAGYDVAGIIHLVDGNCDKARVSRIFTKTALPVVVVGDLHGAFPEVLSDETQSGHLATAHLVGSGHEKIGFIAYETSNAWMRQRIAGYHAALKEYGLEGNAWVVKVPYPEHARSTSEFEEILRPDVHAILPDAMKRCSAVLCASDVIGKLILDYERDQAVGADRRLAFVTFDDRILFRGYDMSAVSHTPEMEARTAYQLLVRRIMNPDAAGGKTRVPGTLFVRQSSRRQRVEGGLLK